MHPYFIVTFVAVIFLLGAAWVIVRENRRQKERHLREFGERYGRLFDHVYSHEELQRISAHLGNRWEERGIFRRYYLE